MKGNASVLKLWDRRQAMLAAGAAATASATPFPCLAAEPATPRVGGIAVVDLRLFESAAFANETVRHGYRISRIGGDITELWVHEIEPGWRRGNACVAGLTEYGAFFCLERLGFDHGLRVIFRGEHRRINSHTALHRLFGAERTTMRDTLLGLQSNDWARHTAWVAAVAQAAPSMPMDFEIAGPARADQPRVLVSWVIGPKRAAGQGMPI